MYYITFFLLSVTAINFIFPMIANSITEITLIPIMYASSLLINKLTIYVITIITMLNLALFLKTCFSHSSSGLLTASTGDSPQIISDMTENLPPYRLLYY